MGSKNQVEKTIEILEKHLAKSRKTTLNREAKYYTPYQTLISCLLSLRSKDETTERVSNQLFKIAKTPQEVLKLSDEQLQKLIFSSGHYKKKAQTLKHVSKEIIEKHNSQVPKTEEQLLAIKGIGRKTANIVLSLAYDKSVIAVDTHVHRIPNRLGWIKTNSPEQTEQELMKILPKKYYNKINGILVLFGRTTCLPISPLCSTCPINKYCKKIGVTKSR